MWLIVGLGNPGSKYALTRHNIGFMAADIFAQGLVPSGNVIWQDEHKALTAKMKIETKGKVEQVLIVKPQTFMNLSGESVVALMNFYKIPRENILVLQDDIDQPFLSMRFHKNRGHGGQNGIRNISELLGTPDYARLKLGIGRPTIPEMQVADYVLGKFSSEEQAQLPALLNRAGDAIEAFLFEGLSKASTQFN